MRHMNLEKSMKQSKLLSMIEVVTNVMIGLVINFTLNYFVLNYLGYKISVSENIGLTLMFTAVAVARGFIVRRFFNHLQERLV